MADNKGKQTDTAELDAITAFLGGDTIDKAFGSQDFINALRMLILSDPDIMQMVFRFRVPSRRHAIAQAVLWRQYEDHGYTKGLKQLQLLFGFQSNINDERINALVQAITAEKREAKQPVGERVRQFIEGIGR